MAWRQPYPIKKYRDLGASTRFSSFHEIMGCYLSNSLQVPWYDVHSASLFSVIPLSLPSILPRPGPYQRSPHRAFETFPAVLLLAALPLAVLPLAVLLLAV